MKTSTIALLICLGLAATATAEGKPKDKGASAGPASKEQLSKIRSIVRELEKAGSTLTGLMADYRSLMERRPRTGGGNREAKEAQQKQLAKWEAAIDRLLRSVDKTHAAVVETTQRLDQASTAKLPTSLAKEVADARNAAEAARVAAEQVLAKHKPKPRSAKSAKSAPAPSKGDEADAHLLDDLDP